jgi:peptidoglycan/xylan/chitin deacetylase (PgdA/CDA1 family)
MASMKKGLSVALEGMGSLLGGNSKRLTVLIFHRVLPEVDPLSPDEMHASRFDALVGTLVHFFNVLPMDEALSRLRAGTLPTRSVAITFDDGYADNYTIACPILIKHGVKATFFVASGFLDGGIMWNDVAREALRSFRGDRLDLSWLDLGVCSVATEAERHRLTETLLPKLKYLTPEGRRTALTRLIGDTGARIPDDLMLTTAQLQGLQAAGMEIGGHTMDHPILAVLSEAEARQQMADNRTHLTRLLGRTILQCMPGLPASLVMRPRLRPHTVLPGPNPVHSSCPDLLLGTKTHCASPCVSGTIFSGAIPGAFLAMRLWCECPLLQRIQAVTLDAYDRFGGLQCVTC